MNKHRIVRFALAAAVASAVAVPVVSQAIRANAQQPPPGQPAPAPAQPTARPPSPAPGAVAPQAAKPDPNKVIIQVGDERITFAEFDAMVNDLPAQEQAFVRGRGKRDFADFLVRTKLLAAEADRRKLGESDKVKRQLQLVRQQVLVGALASDVQAKVEDAALQKYFGEHRAQLERVAARHVLIRSPGSKVPLRPGQKEMTEDQAKSKAEDVAKRVRGGEDFGKIARAESDDTGSGAEGGDLGSFTRGRMVPEFEQAAFGLKEGEISQPIKTEFGWHVIQVTGRYDTLEKLGEQAREQIRAALGPQKMNDLINSLKQTTKVQLDESYLGPPQPETPEQAPPPGLEDR